MLTGPRSGCCSSRCGTAGRPSGQACAGEPVVEDLLDAQQAGLYFATRSERAGAPVLIWPQLVATARSAMVTSCAGAVIVPRSRCAGQLDGVRVSVSKRSAFDEQRVGGAVVARPALRVGDEDRSQPTTPSRSVIGLPPAQSSSNSGSSMETSGYASSSGSSHRLYGGGALLALEGVDAVLVELGGGDVEREGNLLAGGVAGFFDRLEDEVEGPSRFEPRVRGEAALVAEAGGQGRGPWVLLEGVVDLGAQRRASEKCPGRIEAIMNSWMSTLGSACETAVQDVHHRPRARLQAAPR
ncbi:hypothetical protein SALBM311S_06812 [Streptomyces alboniger]